MSGSGAPARTSELSGVRIAVVAASWHEDVMTGLIAGAENQAEKQNVSTQLFRVPGSFELPIVAMRAATSDFDAVVALGVIVRGGTPHFDYVCQAATDGLSQVALTTGVPVGFGVLTCDDLDQALDRAGLPGSSEDKGGEALASVVSTLATLRDIGAGRRPYAGFTPS